MNKKIKQPVCIQNVQSPCGEIILASTDDGLCLCDWYGMPCAERNMRRIKKILNAEFVTETSPILEETKRQLNEYFEGKRHTFNIPLHPIGTDFQLRVWSALNNIPYGETRSYMMIAQDIGNPKGVRAVAQAIGANGICILIPCHRVIGSSHTLVGFTGGLEKKKLLLELEGISPVKLNDDL